MMATHFNPPHEVRDTAKVEAIMESIRTGRSVPPVVVSGYTALTGSHRIAAYERAYEAWNNGAENWDIGEPTLETVEVSDDDYRAACGLLGIDYHDECRDFSQFCAALYHATEDEALKAALADQREGYEDWTDEDFARYAD